MYKPKNVRCTRSARLRAKIWAKVRDSARQQHVVPGSRIYEYLYIPCLAATLVLRPFTTDVVQNQNWLIESVENGVIVIIGDGI